MNPFDIDSGALQLNDLVDHIVNTHHSRVKEMMQLIDSKLSTIAAQESYDQNTVGKLQHSFLRLKDELEQHMRKEEFILFPFIKKMVAIRNGKMSDEGLELRLVQNPLRILEKEHVMITGLLSSIRALTKNFTPEPDSPSSLKLCFAELFAFEQDMHKHIYLENNILFPKILKLEKELSGSKRQSIQLRH